MKKRHILGILTILIISIFLCSCDLGTAEKQVDQPKLGYSGRVFYEIFVRAFNDSNGDGIGDLKGVTQKLDYLQSLGVKGIWLMPINASPSYHGYDVTDYYNINPDYGTMDDYKELIKECHKRNIMVVMDLVLNHTSIQNAWFKQAVSDKNSKYRNYFVWASKTPNADINEVTSMDTKPWIQSGDDYYYAVFWEGMPDLNYDNTEVRAETQKIAKYYLDMGVDGFRLDAAKWIYNDDAKNVEWWKQFNTYVKSVNKNAILVGEIFDDSASQIAPYFKGLDSAFDFPVADTIIKDVKSGNMNGLANNIEITLDTYKNANKDYKESVFLTNHDMNRAMDMLNKDDDAAKQAAGILLTLPGTPYVYYGEETGMTGSKPDEQIRQPFVWSNKDKSKNSSWETENNDINTVAVNVQEKDSNSLLNFYKTIINLRNSTPALNSGTFEGIDTENSGVAAYKRVYKSQEVYVYVNTGRDDVTEKTDLNKVKVLYSNKRSDKKLSVNGKLTLKENEVLILQK